MESREEKIKRMEQELADEKYNLKKEKEEQTRVDKARKYFQKNFPCSFISDNYNFYPEELYESAQTQFVNGYSDNNDESYRVFQMNERAEAYIKVLESDIEALNNHLKQAKEDYEEWRKENVK